MRPSRVPHRLVAVVSASIMAAAVGLVFVAPVSAYTEYWADLSGVGDEDVPATGDIDGTASYRFEFDEDRVCATWTWFELEAPIAAHIHEGAEGVVGPPIVTLPTPTEETGSACAAADPGAIDAIQADPAGFYANIHTGEYPDGAVRGQLFAVELTTVNVIKFVCPDEIQTPDDLAAAPDGTCTPAAGLGTVDEPPEGYEFDPPVLQFDMEVILEDELQVRDLSETTPDGAGLTCDDEMMTCALEQSYQWSDSVMGPTSLRQFTFPDGYRFGWAAALSGIDELDPVDATVDVDGSAIAFDTTGLEAGVFVAMFDFAGEEIEEPTEYPSITPPATSTLATGAPTSAAAGLAATLVVLATVASAALALLARSGRRT